MVRISLFVFLFFCTAIASEVSVGPFRTRGVQKIQTITGSDTTSGPLATRYWVSSNYGGPGGGETNTASNLGGGLANYDSKSGVDLRFNTFASADFDLASNLITIDATKWATKASPTFTGTVTIPSPFTLGATSVTTSGAELNYVDNVTSDIQTQLNAKAALVSPSFTTPTLGAATATTINKVTITAPASASTLTIADGSSLITSGANSLTLTTTGTTNSTFPSGTKTLAATDATSFSSLATVGTITTGVWNGTGIQNNYLAPEQGSITSASAAINTTETVIVQSAGLAANRLQAGTVIRITMTGTCTSTAANASTFSVRIGTNGTTSDGLMMQCATANAATSGTNIPFTAIMELTVRTTGASATCYGYLTLINQGTTGIATAVARVSVGTFTAFNTTTASNIISATYKSAASTTTSTFQVAFVDFVNK